MSIEKSSNRLNPLRLLIKELLEGEKIALMHEEELNKMNEAAIKEKKTRNEKFYEEFGKAIKLGILKDKNNLEKLSSLSRWFSTRKPNSLVSFYAYIKSMK